MNKTLKVGDIGYILGRCPVKILSHLSKGRCRVRYLRVAQKNSKHDRKEVGYIGIVQQVWNYPSNAKYHYPNQDGK